MNIAPNTANIPLATVVNQATETLRRENNQREVISQVAATNAAAAEKGVASDKERGRSPSQTNEQVDFASLQKEAEKNTSTITEQESRQNQQQGNKDNSEDNNSTADKAEEEAQQLAEEKVINQLKIRDKEVRAHEMAHANIGGTTTGAPSYTFEVGPDGKKYAVSGEVDVDLSIVPGDPQATIVKMQKVYAAALAPVSPSIQDTRVAASATQKILTAQSELLALNNEKLNKNSKDDAAGAVGAAKNIDLTKSSSINNGSINRLNDSTLTIQADTLLNEFLQTSPLAQQAPIKQSTEVQQRAERIELFYNSVGQGINKPDNYQFELLA
jgi:hypothetical protein